MVLGKVMQAIRGHLIPRKSSAIFRVAKLFSNIIVNINTGDG